MKFKVGDKVFLAEAHHTIPFKICTCGEIIGINAEMANVRWDIRNGESICHTIEHFEYDVPLSKIKLFTITNLRLLKIKYHGV